MHKSRQAFHSVKKGDKYQYLLKTDPAKQKPPIL